ncbi:hypothetical protein GTW46_05235, partial [Streptomyces sp. SID6013]|nr:hypothetical protein [Streptomyces sp. SID6013]
MRQLLGLAREMAGIRSVGRRAVAMTTPVRKPTSSVERPARRMPGWAKAL